ncbi:multicopper oxidase family protein [Nocardia thailandica]|uniref:multicopper oxidase family protein n=1 Tax=Nocardia thailandica TaxID=257275 RepID=UPI0003088E3D|nr:multicopper oxidase family protein [Nocardia thailandica]
MSTAGWMVFDHACTVLCALAWFAAAGAALAGRSIRLVATIAGLAVALTITRAVAVAVLGARGAWFAQEKVWLGLPLMIGTGALAVAVLARTVAGRGSAGTTLPTVLLGAGYAAVVSFVVSFLLGYPLTPATALISIAVFGATVLLTRRVLTEPEATGATSSNRTPTMPRRRLFGVAAGVAVVGAAATGVGLAARRGPTEIGAQHTGGHTVSVEDLRGPDAPAAGGVVRRQVLTARKATLELPSGEVEAWTFEGTVPGPPVLANQGDLIEVELINHDIDDGVTLHWHGYVACSQDGAAGVTQDAVPPGGRFVYRFRADQVGTYWYHTHFVSHVGVRRGLYGYLIVTPRDRDTVDRRDLTMSVHTFDGHGATVSGGGEHVVPVGTPTRLRLINTDSESHRFALSGTTFRVVAVDGRDLTGPTDIARVALRLPAGGRYDIEFAMPGGAVTVTLDGDTVAARLRPEGSGLGPDPEKPSHWPDLDLLTYGTPAALALSAPDRHFTLVLDRGLARVHATPSYAHTVNGRAYPTIPDQVVGEGEVVQFTVVNRSLDTHPWHLHGHAVLIRARDGRPAQGSPLWVDTLDVRPGEVWDVVFRATNPGLWMNHCHNLAHAEQGMMTLLRYTGVDTPVEGAHAHHGGHRGDAINPPRSSR